MKLLRDAGYELGNIDATVAAERPKLNPHIPLMKKTLAEVMNVDEEDISIKATTTEKLGFTGRQEGINTSESLCPNRPNVCSILIPPSHNSRSGTKAWTS